MLSLSMSYLILYFSSISEIISLSSLEYNKIIEIFGLFSLAVFIISSNIGCSKLIIKEFDLYVLSFSKFKGFSFLFGLLPSIFI